MLLLSIIPILCCSYFTRALQFCCCIALHDKSNSNCTLIVFCTHYLDLQMHFVVTLQNDNRVESESEVRKAGKHSKSHQSHWSEYKNNQKMLTDQVPSFSGEKISSSLTLCPAEPTCERASLRLGV